MEYTRPKQKIAVVFSASWCNTCGPFKRKLEVQGIPYLSAPMDGEVTQALSVYTGWEEGVGLMQIAKMFSVKSLPTTLVFDENLELVSQIVGSDVEAVKNALQK